MKEYDYLIFVLIASLVLMGVLFMKNQDKITGLKSMVQNRDVLIANIESKLQDADAKLSLAQPGEFVDGDVLLRYHIDTSGKETFVIKDLFRNQIITQNLDDGDKSTFRWATMKARVLFDQSNLEKDIENNGLNIKPIK